VIVNNKIRWGMRPGEFDRNMSQRYLTVTANVEKEDMGRASARVLGAISNANKLAAQQWAQRQRAAGREPTQEAIDEAGMKPPEGVTVQPMGQLPPMQDMFNALGVGLTAAVFVILVLLTAYFQSVRLGLISIGSVPGVLAGIAFILYFTNTGMNIESFMGSIMCLGVSVSNSVMLVTFMDEHWKTGKPSAEAAIVGAGERLRPVLMTACAMVVGMVPMALALEKGSQMQAPLALAVIGGLVMSTIATLLVVPSIFAVVIGSKQSMSPSLYPDDKESLYYDPNFYSETSPEGDTGHVPTHGSGPEVVAHGKPNGRIIADHVEPPHHPLVPGPQEGIVPQEGDAPPRPGKTDPGQNPSGPKPSNQGDL